MEVVVDRSLMSTLILSKAFVKMHLHPKAISATGPPGLSFVQPLERTSSPCIINISSIMANKGSVAASAVVYATSKAGLIGFTKALAAECSYMMTIGRTENRIRVNALLTGYIEHVRVPGQFKLPSTRMITSNSPQYVLLSYSLPPVETRAFYNSRKHLLRCRHAGLRQKNLDKMIPMGRLGTADEVADAALFLATNEYANNCVLNLDGGLSAMRKWYLRKLLLIQTDVACHNRLMNLRQIPGLHHQD
jgi:NAD(P)-dependent dehydrogenase (short-subunit alcohol dehydrogenase family)